MVGILRKDALQHGWLLVPAVGVAAAVGVAWVAIATGGGGDPLGAFRAVVLAVLAPLTWLFVSRLVVCEYSESGWSALATFPCGPGRAVAVKALVVAATLFTLLSGAWVVAVAAALTFGGGAQEAAALDALRRAGGFCCLLVGYLLLAATLGRHRLALHGALAAGLAAAAGAGVRLSSLPGLTLLGRRGEGADRLEVAAGLGLALLLAAAGLAAARARAWQGPSSRGALAGGAAGGLVAVLLGGALAPAPAFALEGEAVRRDGLPLAVAVRGSDGRAAAAATFAAVAPALTALEERVGLTLGEAAVILDRALDPRTVVGAERGGSALVRAHPRAAQLVPVRLRARIVRRALDEATGGRLRAGGWRLLLDGLPGHAAATAPGLPPAAAARWRDLRDRRAAWGLRALERAGRPLDGRTLTRWSEVRRRVGDTVAQALAEWTLEQVEAARPGAAWSLARSAWAARRGPFGGVGARAGAFAAALRQAAGLSAEQAAARLRSAGRELRRRFVAELAGAALPEVAVGLEVAPAGDLRAVHVWFRPGSRSGQQQQATGPARAVVLHGLPGPRGLPLAPFREEAPTDGVRRRAWHAYPPGAAVAVAVGRYDPALQCDLLAGWRLLEAP